MPSTRAGWWARHALCSGVAASWVLCMGAVLLWASLCSAGQPCAAHGCMQQPQSRCSNEGLNPCMLLCTDCSKNCSTTGPRPDFLQAPELVTGASRATPACDVYAFGIVMWELLAWQLPWAGLTPIQVSLLRLALRARGLWSLASAARGMEMCLKTV